MNCGCFGVRMAGSTTSCEMMKRLRGCRSVRYRRSRTYFRFRPSAWLTGCRACCFGCHLCEMKRPRGCLPVGQKIKTTYLCLRPSEWLRLLATALLLHFILPSRRWIQIWDIFPIPKDSYSAFLPANTQNVSSINNATRT